MVLRGAQFLRSGPAGCASLTRRALFSYRATFGTDISLVSTAWMSVRNLTEDSRPMARAGDLCHGDIGESSSALQP